MKVGNKLVEHYHYVVIEFHFDISDIFTRGHLNLHCYTELNVGQTKKRNEDNVHVGEMRMILSSRGKYGANPKGDGSL